MLRPHRRRLLLLLMELAQVQHVPLGWVRVRVRTALGLGEGSGYQGQALEWGWVGVRVTWRMASRSSPARCSYSFILLSHIELNCLQRAYQEDVEGGRAGGR